MLDQSFAWVPTLAVVASLGVVGVYRGRGFAGTLVPMLVATYVGWLVAVTLFPVPIDHQWLSELRVRDTHTANIVPLATVADAIGRGPHYFLRQVGGNLLLLVPLGALVAHRCRRCGPVRVAGCCLAFSLSIELVQVLVSVFIRYPYRRFDIDDVLLNVCGGVCGFLVYRVAHAKPQR